MYYYAWDLRAVIGKTAVNPMVVALDVEVVRVLAGRTPQLSNFS